MNNPTNNCPQSDIDKFIASQPSLLTMGYLDYEIDNNNLENPASLVVRTDLLQTSASLYHQLALNLKQVVYTTD